MRKAALRGPAGKTPDLPPVSRSSTSDVAICLSLVVAVTLVFAQTVNHEFVNFDDDVYVFRNPHVRQGLTLSGLQRAFTGSDASNWHPLTWISHMLDWQEWGSWAGGHHLTSVAIHAAAAVLLFLTLRQMTGYRWQSAVVAAFFAVHPLHVESVAWVAERKDVLSGLFFVLALAAYVGYVRKPASLLRYLLVPLVFALGLLCKPMLVTLPLVLLLLDYWPLGRVQGAEGREEREKGRKGERESTAGPQPIATPRSELSTASLLPAPCSLPMPPTAHLPLSTLLIEKVPLFALSLISCALTLIVQKPELMAAKRITFPMRLGNAVESYAAYLFQVLWPARLAAFYPHPYEKLAPVTMLVSVAILVSISWLVVVQRARRPYLLVGWLWYLLMLLPVIGLVQVGMQARADRYTYLPLIGPCLAMVWAVSEKVRRYDWLRGVASLATGLVLACLAALAWQQTTTWRNSLSLWTHALTIGYESDRAHNNLACFYDDAGQPEMAQRHYQAALRLAADSADIHVNFGRWLVSRGRTDEGIAQYRMALKLCPRDSSAESSLGLALVARGDLDEAAVHFKKAIAIEPENAQACYNLGSALLRLGRLEEAAGAFEQSLKANPDQAAAVNNLANIHYRFRRLDEAAAGYRRAIAIDPNYAEAHNNLGLLLDELGQRTEALSQFHKVLEIDPDNAQAHNSLGVLLMNEGMLSDSIEHFRRAIAIDPKFDPPHANLGRALSRRGENAAAVVELRTFLRSHPNEPEVLGWLAWIFATAPEDAVRSGKEAVELAQRAVAAGRGDLPQLLDTLAAAYAETGQFKDAIETARKARKAAEPGTDRTLSHGIEARLKLYESGRPYREAAPEKF